MDTWDQQKLEEVVAKKHGERDKKNATTTEIVEFYYVFCFSACVALVFFINNFYNPVLLHADKSSLSLICQVQITHSPNPMSSIFQGLCLDFVKQEPLPS